MYRVLQQEWINGKSCLVEEDQLEALLDIVNLSSESVQKEADIVSWQGETNYLDEISQETLESGLEITAEEHEKEQAIAEVVEAALAQEVETKEKPIEKSTVQGLYGEETWAEEAEVVAWYYWPNGSLIKSY